MKKFPWDCKDCPMLHTYDMSIDDLTHVCLWSKKQIDDCDRYKSAECPMEKHDTDLLDKVAEKIREYSGLHYVDCDGYFGGIAELIFKVDDWLDEVIAEMKAEVDK